MVVGFSGEKNTNTWGADSADLADPIAAPQVAPLVAGSLGEAHTRGGFQWLRDRAPRRGDAAHRATIPGLLCIGIARGAIAVARRFGHGHSHATQQTVADAADSKLSSELI